MKIPRAKGRPIVAVIAPLPPHAGEVGRQRPAAIVLITDPERRATLATDMLRQLHGLTPAEVRVTELVVSGLSIEAAADVLGIARNTARNQLQSVYGKTGATRLTALVEVFIRLSVLMRKT